MTKEQNRFEKHSKTVYAVVYALIGIVLLVVSLLIVKAVRDEMKRGGERYIGLREPRPFLDHSEEPGPEVMKSATGLEKRPYRIRVDSDGFIMPSKIHADPDRSIVFLGGSTTECEYMDEEARFPYLVGRHLEKSLGLKVNSYNTARSGNNSMHSLFILQAKVIPMKPKAVVLMECVNELTFLIYMGSYYSPHYNRGLIGNMNYDPIKNFILSYVRDKAVEQYDAKDEFSGHTGTGPKISIREICDLYKKNLELFVFICRQHGIAPVLMTQFNRLTPEYEERLRTLGTLASIENRWGISYRQYIEYYSKLNNMHRVVAAEQHVALIDLDKDLPKSSEYMYDSVHLSEKGSRFVAEVIAKQLEPIVR